MIETFLRGILYGILFFIALVVVITIIKVKIKKAEKAAKEEAERQRQFEQKREWLTRQVQIFNDCVDLISRSENLDVVARRYNALIEITNKLMPYTQKDLEEYGIHIKRSFSAVKSELIRNKEDIFEDAIYRAHRAWVEKITTMKTQVGKEHSLDTFEERTSEIIIQYELPSECLEYLSTLCYNTRGEIAEELL